MAVVTRAGPPRHRAPRHLGRRPGHQRRAFHQPGRRPAEPAPGRDPDLPLPGPGPVPGLPSPHSCQHLPLHRRGQHLLPVPAQPQEPRHAAAAPGHPRTVKAPAARLDEIVRLFFKNHVFGPRRAGLLAVQLPATDAAAIADRDASADAIKTRLKQIQAGQDSCILELEQLPADPADTASAALRGRIRARFADLHREREQLDSQLAVLAAVTPRAADPALCCPALKIPILAAFTTPMKNRAFRAVSWGRCRATWARCRTQGRFSAVVAVCGQAGAGNGAGGSAGRGHGQQPAAGQHVDPRPPAGVL